MLRSILLCLLLLAAPALAQQNYQPPPPGQLNLIATGTNQANALVLPAQVNVFSSVPLGTGVRPPSTPTSVVVVNNDPANTLLFYPPSGDQIIGLAVNAPASVPAGQQATLTWFGSALNPPPRQWVLIPAMVPTTGGTFTGTINAPSFSNSGNGFSVDAFGNVTANTLVGGGTGAQLVIPGAKTAGRFYASQYVGTPTNTVVGAAGQLYAVPIFIGNTSVAKSLSFDIGTGISGAWNARMGLYTSGTNGLPSTLVANSDTGTIAVASGSTTGVQTGTMNGSTGVTLAPGWYWMAVNFDTATTNAVYSTVNADNTLGRTVLGTNSANNIFVDNVVSGIKATQTFGAMPATFPTASYIIAASAPDIVIGF